MVVLTKKNRKKKKGKGVWTWLNNSGPYKEAQDDEPMGFNFPVDVEANSVALTLGRISDTQVWALHVLVSC